ncbi:MOSC domain-containing protein YiiM [Paenibacillus sp. 453mf]|nr:MOSC domain-containing protein YiiM [Paenibacillus sp. 453mf]
MTSDVASSRVVSLNVGSKVKMMNGSKEIYSAIFKSPTAEQLFLSRTGFHGDEQADLVNHGGADKAVCVFNHQAYAVYEDLLGRALDPGAFGENVTVSGFGETDVYIGDTFQLGEAVVQISQPRVPCFKLGLKHQHKELPLHFQTTGLTGYYYRVLTEGNVSSEDSLTLRAREQDSLSVMEANVIMHHRKSDISSIKKLLSLSALAASWKETLSKRLAKLETT